MHALDVYIQHVKHIHSKGKALKYKPSAEFDVKILEMFGLKIPLNAYVLGEHTSMKNQL